MNLLGFVISQQERIETTDRTMPGPRGVEESEIAQATRHVAVGRRIVADQRPRVARLKALGRDTSESADLRAIQDKTGPG